MSCSFCIIRVWSVGIYHVNELCIMSGSQMLHVTSELCDAFQKVDYYGLDPFDTFKTGSIILRLIKE